MELITDPANELHFKGPFDSVKATHLKLINPTDRKIIFKIKTTAPKYYCVRPNGGVLYPKVDTKISVMLQPFDAKFEDRTKDKFMVQSTFIPEDKEDQVTSNEYPSHLWSEIPPAELKNRKLKCVFFPSSDSEEPIPTVVAAASNVSESVSKAKHVVPESTVSEVSELAEMLKLQEETKALSIEVQNLLRENSKLKEESMRFRTAYSARATKQQEQEAKSAKPGSVSKDVSPLSQIPIYLVLTSVLILLLGVYIGKNVL